MAQKVPCFVCGPWSALVAAFVVKKMFSSSSEIRSDGVGHHSAGGLWWLDWWLRLVCGEKERRHDSDMTHTAQSR